jgi:uncharacterized membrane protein YdjX (TVP38/TMEM64 family)
MKKILFLIFIATLVTVFLILDLDRYLTLSYIQTSKERFELLYSEHPAGVIAGYMAIYIIVTALSLPGAAIMSLAGGACFGLLVGTLAVSFASTIGATLACFAARFILHNWVQTRFSNIFEKINNGIKNEGASYLFTLRLIPLFPFWMINLAMGLTKIRLSTFYWVSQVGMLPGTIVYINAGRELGKIESLSSIISPTLLFSFALLGLFPITAKKCISLYRTRKGT